MAVTVGCASPKKCCQQITKDKYYHLAAGAATGIVANEINMPKVSSAFVAGFAKESYDYIRYGRFDTKDLVATTLGGILVRYIIKLIKKEDYVEVNEKIPEGHLGTTME